MYYYVARGMEEEDRRQLDELLEQRPVQAYDPDAPPPWWKGDEDASKSALQAAQMMGVLTPEMMAQLAGR